MKSIVLELQHAAMERSSAVDDLLRKCVVIATKLGLGDSVAWARAELNGYTAAENIPDYRIVPGEVKSFNPYNGVWLPFIWTDGPPEGLRERDVRQSVAEIQDLLDEESDGTLIMNLPEKMAYHLMTSSNSPRLPVFIIGRSSFVKILDAVRNSILDWSLKLENDGILGEGMSFSQEEKQIAMGHTYNIENFSGVLGDVTSGSLQIGDYNSVHSDLKALGIAQEDRNELEELMDRAKDAEPEEKKALIKKGLGWVAKHGDKLGNLSDSLRGWFETVA
ncbi:hypothetical protein NT6N_18550 [Oceaniferula spumae]|uniref:AbiTii domain-containing protein n=1 Tax=Oceaniferula spumae TaxID=2979115 RepID=A0AAT9FLG8_9BACT